MRVIIPLIVADIGHIFCKTNFFEILSSLVPNGGRLRGGSDPVYVDIDLDG